MRLAERTQILRVRFVEVLKGKFCGILEFLRFAFCEGGETARNQAQSSKEFLSRKNSILERTPSPHGYFRAFFSGNEPLWKKHAFVCLCA